MDFMFNIFKLIKRDKYKKESYAQCGEDIIIDYIFSMLKIVNPTYLDLGAHHPRYLSNTYYFYKKGINGILVEPDPELCIDIRNDRPNDICLNVGVGIINSQAKFYIMTTRTLNTFSKKDAERYSSYGNQKIERITKIQLLPLNTIIEKYCVKTPNLVSLDIEGLDFEVITSLNLEKYRPEVICIETLTYSENKTETKTNNIIDYMLSSGYFIYADTYINTIFVDIQVWKKR
ncbi:FkbM family methyltransferase [Pectinatus frisingensis]|uniref:FkbM family methyltransferase n=1 Tax=Pectinatus frisingensis TaxID=865 RepID=UPI0018C558B7|nr:FkbM family methyltransferase [Pectinatus frisingensis]